MKLIETIDQVLTENLLLDDINKSLNSLVKNNKGVWKSDKQAAYLMRGIENEGTLMGVGGAEDKWLSKHEFDKGSSLIFTYRYLMSGYGTVTKSKQRWVGRIFIVDSVGVRAAGKLKFKLDRVLDDYVVSSVEDAFERPEGMKAPGGFDYFGRKKAAAKAARAQAKANKPMIDKIKALPAYSDENGWSFDILQSFVRQLEGGRKLSTKQLAIVQRVSPEPVMGTGEADGWLDQVERVRGTFLKAGQAYNKALGDLVKHRKKEMTKAKAEVKRNQGIGPKEMKQLKAARNYLEKVKLFEKLSGHKVDTKGYKAFERPVRECSNLIRAHENAERSLKESKAYVASMKAGVVEHPTFERHDGWGSVPSFALSLNMIFSMAWDKELPRVNIYRQYPKRSAYYGEIAGFLDEGYKDIKKAQAAVQKGKKTTQRAMGWVAFTPYIVKVTESAHFKAALKKYVDSISEQKDRF